MAANETDPSSLLRVVNQLQHRVDTLDNQHSRSVSQAVRPIEGDVQRLKDELAKAQKKLGALETDFKSFQTAERERRKQYKKLQDGLLDARAATAAAEREIAVIDGLLAEALPFRRLSFDQLTDPGRVADFSPGREGVAEPEPRWDDYDPGAQAPWSRAASAVGIPTGYERRLEERRLRYADDLASHGNRELQRELDLAERRRLYDLGVAEIRARADAWNAEVERMRAAFAAGDAKAIAWFARQALERCEYPAWYPSQSRRYRIACRPDQGDLLVELVLPPAKAIPAVRRYEYDEHSAGRREFDRSPAEISAQYTGLIASVAIRTAGEALTATAEQADVVRTATINGLAVADESATGSDSRTCLISVSVTREGLGDLFLARVQPLLCLATMDARISLDPLGGLPVEPIEDFPESGEPVLY